MFSPRYKAENDAFSTDGSDCIRVAVGRFVAVMRTKTPRFPSSERFLSRLSIYATSFVMSTLHSLRVRIRTDLGARIMVFASTNQLIAGGCCYVRILLFLASVGI